MANNQRPHKYGLHAKFQTLTFETEAMVRSQSNVQTRFWGFVLYSKLWRLPPPAFVASSPPSSRPQAVAPRPLWRLPPPAFVASSSPPSSRPQAVAPRPLWRLPPPASVASSPPSSRPQAVAPRPLWRLPPPAFFASRRRPWWSLFLIFGQMLTVIALALFLLTRMATILLDFGLAKSR